ncbi:MAG: hypothetical protein IJU91_06435 [Selenomonadaceae bacterium]|nr:hypothetical protein [Selenomonadaceae bacterium]
MSYNVEGLEFLKDCTNEELGVLVELITDKGSLTELLTGSKVYKENYPNHRAYVDLIQQEIIDFGYNSLNIFGDRSYKEVVKKVCKKMKVYDSSDDMYEMENKILGKAFHDSFDKMTEEDKKAILQDLNLNGLKLKDLEGRGGTLAFAGLFKAGGFGSYKMSVIVANSLARMITGKGLSLAVNAGLTRALSVFAGPFAIIMAAWTVVDIAGPAYRVISNAVPAIAALRKIHAN